MILVGHSDFIVPLLELFNWHIIDNPPPSSSIFIDFFECTDGVGAERWKVQVRFHPNSRDLADQIVLPYDELSSDGLNTNEKFENWIMAGLNSFAKYTGTHILDFKIVGTQSYSYNHTIAPFASV